MQSKNKKRGYNQNARMDNIEKISSEKLSNRDVHHLTVEYEMALMHLNDSRRFVVWFSSLSDDGGRPVRS